MAGVDLVAPVGPQALVHLADLRLRQLFRGGVREDIAVVLAGRRLFRGFGGGLRRGLGRDHRNLRGGGRFCGHRCFRRDGSLRDRKRLRIRRRFDDIERFRSGRRSCRGEIRVGQTHALGCAPDGGQHRAQRRLRHRGKLPALIAVQHVLGVIEHEQRGIVGAGADHALRLQQIGHAAIVGVKAHALRRVHAHAVRRGIKAPVVAVQHALFLLRGRVHAVQPALQPLLFGSAHHVVIAEVVKIQRASARAQVLHAGVQQHIHRASVQIQRVQPTALLDHIRAAQQRGVTVGRVLIAGHAVHLAVQPHVFGNRRVGQLDAEPVARIDHVYQPVQQHIQLLALRRQVTHRVRGLK